MSKTLINFNKIVKLSFYLKSIRPTNNTKPLDGQDHKRIQIINEVHLMNLKINEKLKLFYLKQNLINKMKKYLSNFQSYKLTMKF